MSFEKPLLIAGLPRSGTSMVTGILGELGLWLGKTVKGQEIVNPKGFFEHVKLREKINKGILRKLGCDPLGVKKLPDIHGLPPMADLKETVARLLEADHYDGKSPWGFKDAKLTLLWPIWKNAFPEAHWLIVHRPRELVIRSCLKTRFMRQHSTDPAFWAAFCDQYDQRLDLLRQAAPDVMEVDAARLIDGDYAQLQQVADRMGLAWDARRVRAFIEPDFWAKDKDGGADRRAAGTQTKRPVRKSANPPRDQQQRLLDLYNQGRFDQAVEAGEALCVQYPNAFFLWNLTGAANAGLKRFSKAQKAFAKAVKLKPDDAAGHHNLAGVLKAQGRDGHAADCYRQALKLNPAYLDAYRNLGAILAQQGQWHDAATLYQQALKHLPDELELFARLGRALEAEGRLDDAARRYEQILQRQPDNFEIRCALANILFLMDRLDEAAIQYRQALPHGGADARPLINLAIIERRQGRPDAAEALYRQALDIDRDNVDAHINLGVLYRDQGKLSAAEDCYRKALALKPDFAEAHYNLSNLLKDQGRTAEALASMDKALALKPDYDAAYANKSLLLLIAGEFEQGWKLYDGRWQSRKLVSGRPKWTLESGRRVLLWAEQGIGDHVMFASVIPEMAELCSELIVQTDRRLIPLFERSFDKHIRYVGLDEAVDERDYDRQIAMGSVMQYLRRREEDFAPARSGYLVADADKCQRLAGLLDGEARTKRVGLSWRSGNDKNGRARSIDLAPLVKALAAPDVQFVNLQYGDTDVETAAVSDSLGVDVLQVDDIDNFNDIDGLAALISVCDTVVSIDNSTVHLAGSLGKDVRILLPFASDWRWQRARTDSYWYDSATLYRQEKPGEWDVPLARLARDI